MPVISTVGGIWADVLDPIVRFKFDQAFQRRASLLATLFNVQSSSRAYEAVSGVGAIGVDAWNNYKNAGTVSEVDFNQGYKKIYTHVEYPLDIGIERKTIDDMQGDVFRQVERMGDSAAVKRESDAASVFNNAFTDTAPYAGADAVGLCSTVHPLSPMNAGTQSNEFTYALTKSNVSTIREAMMALTDDNGNKVAITPTAILVPPALEDEAIEISKSMLDPTSGNNTVNVHAGRFTVITWHYLTDSNAWFMLDTNQMKLALDWFDRVALGIKLRDGDDRTLVAYWRAYMRYSFGWSDWKWCAGSNPS